MAKTRKTCYTIYTVPKKGKPKKIANVTSKLDARRIVKNIPDRKFSFTGFAKCGRRVTSKSKFSY